MSWRSLSNGILTVFGILFCAVVGGLVAAHALTVGMTRRNWAFVLIYTCLITWVFLPNKRRG